MALAYDTGGRPFVGSNRPALMLPQMVRDASAYYLLGYASPAPVDGKFHKIKVRLKKDGYEVRARSGYFAPTVGEMERGRAAGGGRGAAGRCRDARSASCRQRRGPIAPSISGSAWRGGERQDACHRGLVARASTAAAGEVTLELSAAVPHAETFFTASKTAAREISFDAPPGDVMITTTARNGRGEEIDGGMRRVTVPAFGDSQLAIGSPAVLRARSVRDARNIAAGVDLRIEVGREFERTDRVFVRVPVYGGADVAATARLLNRFGTELRALPLSQAGGDVYLLDLPLSATPRGDYLIAIDAARGTESVRALVPLRVR